MKKYVLTFLICFSSAIVEASHVHSSQLRIDHISGYDYKIHLVIFRDASGIAVPPTVPVSAYQRDGAIQMNSFTLQLDTSYIINPSILGCPTGILFDANEYSLVVTLSASTYNHPGGYLFYWQSCCRNSGLVNILNSSSIGLSALTLFPPVVDSSGNQIINSSPILNSPISDYAINQVPYSNDFGGVDPDGDSLVYELASPFEIGAISGGTSTALFAPYPDPSTQVSAVPWAPGFNIDDQIHGFPGPNPSPNRLKIDLISGILTVTPNISGNGIFAYAIVCREYRNGKLIGATYRNSALYVVNNSGTPIINVPPEVHVPNNQALANWLGDTLIFTGSPVCVQLNVTDPDTLADIRLELVQSDYDPLDINFVQSSAIIQGNDTFTTALCFSPDTFLSHSTEARLLALDNICHNVKSDTLSFFFKFVGYSNAGAGGRIAFAINPSQPHIDLFALLGGNPNPGGIWIDLDNSNLLNANNQFIAQNVFVPSTFRFQYIDQQPNYPADTAELELEFYIVQGLGELDSEGVIVYPNPAKDILNVSSITEESVFEIYDIHGHLLKTFELIKGNNFIRTDDISDGLYFYQYQNQRGKFLIQR